MPLLLWCRHPKSYSCPSILSLTGSLPLLRNAATLRMSSSLQEEGTARTFGYVSHKEKSWLAVVKCQGTLSDPTP